MPPTNLGKSPQKTPRGPKPRSAHLFAIPQVQAARHQILQRRAVAGSSDVTQEDVDLAARTLLAVRERPYPQAIVAVTGGSLSTVGPLFHDWFMRFAYRDAEPNSPALDVPTRISLHVQRLVAQLEAAVREQIRGVPDPTQALIAAAQLGEQQGLKTQLSALTADRERMSEALAAMTYKVSELESQLATRAAVELTANNELKRATDRLQSTFDQLREQLTRPAPTAHTALTRLAAQVRQLRTDLKQSRRTGSRDANRKPAPKSRTQQSRRAGHGPGPRRPPRSAGSRRRRAQTL